MSDSGAIVGVVWYRARGGKGEISSTELVSPSDYGLLGASIAICEHLNAQRLLGGTNVLARNGERVIDSDRAFTLRGLPKKRIKQMYRSLNSNKRPQD